MHRLALSRCIARTFATPRPQGPHTPARICSVSGARCVNTRAASADTQTFTAAALSQAQPVAAAEPAMPATKDDVKGDMLKPSVVNTSWVRTLAMIGAVVATAGSTAVLPTRLNAFLHVAAYGLWFGTNIWNTFFVGLTMFKHMPRQMFGRVQAQLFPKYFALTTAANVLVLASWVLGGSAASPITGATVNLGVALAASLANAAYIEPIASKLMLQRYDIENKEEKTEEDKTQIAVLYKQFGIWHGISSLLNLIITCAALAHGWHLAGAITL